MLFSSKKTFIIFLILIFGFSLLLASAKKEDVEQKVISSINKSPKLKAKLIKKLFKANVNGNDYDLVKFTITNIKQLTFPVIDYSDTSKVDMIKKALACQRAFQCEEGDHELNTKIRFSKTSKSTTTVKNEVSLSTSVTAEVGVQIEIVNASIATTLSGGYLNSTQRSVSTTTSIEHEASVTIKGRQGKRLCLYLLQHKPKDEEGVPYSAKFTIVPTSTISLEFEAKKPATVTLFENLNYSGKSVSFQVPYGTVKEIPRLKKYNFNNILSSIKIDGVNGKVKLVLYKRNNFKGKSFSLNSNNLPAVPAEFNDKISSIKIYAEKLALTTSYSYIKNDIPEKIGTFTAKGHVVFEDDIIPVTVDIYPQDLTEEELNDLCGGEPPAVGATGTTKKSSYKSSRKGIRVQELTQAEIERLIMQGKIKRYIKVKPGEKRKRGQIVY